MTPPTRPTWIQGIINDANNNCGSRPLQVDRLLSALSECIKALRKIQRAHEEIPEGCIDAGFCDNCGFTHPCGTRQIVDALLTRYESGEIGR